MKIKLLVSRATATETQNRGQEIEVSDAEGQRMADAGQCVILPQAERAVKHTKVEKAMK